MPPTNDPPPAAGYVTFHEIGARTPADAHRIAEASARLLRRYTRHSPGFRSARVHLSLDATAVVVRGEWDGAQRPDTALGGPAGRVLRYAERLGRVPVSAFRGVPAPGIEGPAKGRRPGLVVVATRQVGSADNARKLSGLLLRSSEWKSGFSGFVAADPCVSEDGGTYVNYPQWVDEDAFDAYMSDPRNAEGREAIAGLEVAPPRFVLCTMVAQIDAEPSRPGRPAGAGHPAGPRPGQ
ncbi:putative quinol monooxygenase [Streptomyces cyaneofuscatus]|uniref:putative quinol monooxygenase n=1 Tax=Streptomyces cyaneofuscatus TaxID=66883 RepID=UPI00364F6503